LFFFPTHIPFGCTESREFWQQLDPDNGPNAVEENEIIFAIEQQPNAEW
jgi:hypothetical protein